MAKKKDSSFDLDFDDWFQAELDSTLKSCAKDYKLFKHPIFNYTTGMVRLDYMINPTNPGILGGNIIQFAGIGHSGKTTHLLNMEKIHLDRGHRVIHVDVENGLTDNFAKKYGITKCGTPGFKYVKLPGGSAEEYFKFIYNTLYKLQGSPDPVLIGIDSIPLLRPKPDLDKPPRVGDNIAFFNNFLRAIIPLVGNTNALVVLLNGVYQDNSSPFNDYIVSGGEFLNRACSLIILNYRKANPSNMTSDIHYKVAVGKQEIVYRQKLGIKILKNKWHHCDPKEAQLDYFLNTDERFVPIGLDNIQSMLAFLKEIGELTGAGNYTLDSETMRWKDWEETCRNNPEIFNKVVNKTLIGLRDLYLNPIN